MDIKQLIKKTFLYEKIYYPHRVAKINEVNKRKRELFKRDGLDALRSFTECMEIENITYWLEFGTLLGIYRDGDFVPNEMDLDVGVHLKDAKKLYKTLTSSGFELCREFHVIGENGLEQTYKYRGTTIDVMYFYEEDNEMWCNGSIIPSFKIGEAFEYKVTAWHFKKFECKHIPFKGLSLSIPANTEEHIIEVYGPGYKVYDPNFRVGYNKVFYEKKGIGFVNY